MNIGRNERIVKTFHGENDKMLIENHVCPTFSFVLEKVFT